MAYKCLSLCRFRGFTAGFCKNFVQRFQKFKMRFQGKAKNFDLFRMRKKFRVQVERNFPTLSHERFSIVEPVVQFEKLLGNIIVFINGVAGGFLCLLHRYFVRLDFLRLRHIILDFLKNFSLFFGLGLAEIFEKIIGNTRTGEDTMRLLMECAAEFGQTLIVVTHNPEIAQKAQQVIRIEDGWITGNV